MDLDPSAWTNLKIKNLLLQVSEQLNITYLFLQCLKNQHDAIKNKFEHAEPSEFIRFSSFLQQCVDLLMTINNVLKNTCLSEKSVRGDVGFYYNENNFTKLEENGVAGNVTCQTNQLNTMTVNLEHFNPFSDGKIGLKRIQNLGDPSELPKLNEDLNINVKPENKTVIKFAALNWDTQKLRPLSTAFNEKELKSSESDSPSDGKLKKGIEVSVEHLESPSELYVLFSGMHDEMIKQLNTKLKSIPVNYDNIKTKKSSSCKHAMSQNMNDYVLYYSICDEAWLRARILDWCLEFDDDLVTISLIDTGENKCASVCYLEAMPDYIRHYPVFLKRCHLSGICPKNKKGKLNQTIDWMTCITEQLRFWLETSKKVTIQIDSSVQNLQSSLPIIMWMIEKEKSINQLLIDSNLADKIENNSFPEEKNSWGTANDFLLEKWNPMIEDYKAYNNVPDLNPTNPGAVIYGHIGTDSSRICQQFANEGKCYKKNSCRKEHKRLNPSGFTIDQEFVFIKTMKALQSPRIGDILCINVTEILGVNSFCCIVKDPEPSVTDETLEDLNAFLNDTENVRGMKKLTVPPSAGQIVIGNYSFDDGWYRAQVLSSQPENDKYDILFVDYGNTETVPLSRLRAIEPQYLHLPFQCIRCFICGIKSVSKFDETRNAEGIRHLAAIISDRILIIEVVDLLPGNLVSLLVNLYDDEGNDIAEELVSSNWGTLEEEMLLPEECSLLPG